MITLSAAGLATVVAVGFLIAGPVDLAFDTAGTVAGATGFGAIACTAITRGSPFKFRSTVFSAYSLILHEG